jgi:putative ABC transport system ATP-binding protein
VSVLLSAEGLGYTARGDTGPHVVLDRVSVALDSGEIVDVTGPSGAGKTTLLRALARLLPDVTGSLALSGRPADEFAPPEWRRRVTLLPQTTALMPGTVRDNLLLPWSLKVRSGDRPPPDGSLEQALRDVGLAEIALTRDASRLSVGQAARVALLRVVLAAPAVLLLDEPEANLDDESAAQVAVLTERFAASGGAVVRVRHQRGGVAASRTLQLAGGHLTEVAR